MAKPVVPPAPGLDPEGSWLTTRRALWAVIGVSTLLRLAWASTSGRPLMSLITLQYIQHPDVELF